ncbi:MAG TPA: VPDSG-CTERM sorting domain-containing protein [Verrucomicrobiae bacterium]|nr:VPDSG-CTERM sorting domain-containing protein [Verrucomicrobiae bacterium]
MRRSTKHLLVSAVIIFGLITSTHATTIGFGSVTDPTGDNASGTPDITSASVTIDSAGTALFAITYASGTSLGAAAGSFALDTDKNPATGSPGVDTGNNDSALMGSDYALTMDGSSFSGKAIIYKYVSGSFSLVDTISVTYLGTTEEVLVPLSDLGGTSGAMNFVAESQTEISLGTYTGIGDYAPNLNLTPGTVTLYGAPEVSSTLTLLGCALLGLAALRRRLS